MDKQSVLEGVNQLRKDAGLEPLTQSEALNASAQHRADVLCMTGGWSHDGALVAIKKEYNYSMAGENLARKFKYVDPMIEAWQNSETHYKNITADYKDMGVGITECQGQTIVVNHFGTPAVNPASYTGVGVVILAVILALIIRKFNKGGYGGQEKRRTI